MPSARAIQDWITDAELPGLWDQTVDFADEKHSSWPSPSEVDVGDGRIRVSCFA